MESYIIVLAGFGIIVLLTAWLPMLLKELPLSLPILCVAFGAALFTIDEVPGVAPEPLEHLELTERLTELVVIISLFGAGLKIDRACGWRSWRITWRLLGIAMPLTIAGLAGLAYALLGLEAASALLLAAALAPTDPVLASDVQVGGPGEGQEDEVRFALTSEAGLNDGLAFPFVHLAIAAALASHASEASTAGSWLWDWFSVKVVWKIAAGIGFGWLMGAALGWLTFQLPNRANLSRTGDGFVALGVTCLTYGLTELIHGYGFLAVFVAGLALRSAERNHSYHTTLHDFAEQLERLLMMALLVVFGATLTGSRVLETVTWETIAFALLAIFVVRPVSGLIGLAGIKRPLAEKAVVGFFGIRGLGSAYYLAFALGEATFAGPELVWSTMSIVVVISIFLHGTTVTPIMRRLDRLSRREPPRDSEGPHAGARGAPAPIQGRRSARAGSAR